MCCTVCGSELTRETVTVTAKGHDYKTEVTKPTCTEGGYTTYTCSRCEDRYVADAVAATGHLAGDAADCTRPQTCTVCGIELKAALGHDYKGIVTEPTHMEGGYTTYTCSRCRDSYVADEVPAIGGTPGDNNTGGGNTGSDTGGSSGGNAGSDTGVSSGGNTGGNSQGSGTGPPTERIPISSDNASIEVEISLSGNAVTIEKPNMEALKQVTDSEETGGSVVIDLSQLDDGIHGVEIPAQILRELDEGHEEKEHDLEIRLPTGTLTFDPTAVDAILAQSKGKDVRIHLEDVGTERLNAAQKKALQGKDVRKGYEAYILVDGTRVSDFKGGRAEMNVHIPRGKNDRAEGFTVWFVDEDGSMEKLNSWYDGKTKTFVVGHFSDYVIIYEDLIREDFLTCTQDKECPLNDYVDIDANAWYHDGVHYCLENGLMLGVGEKRFLPEGEATRAMVITMLWRLSGSPVMGDTQTFTDVADGQWYTEAIRWAKAVEITKGYDDGRFGVHDSVTREQLAVFLYQYALSKGYDVSGGNGTKLLSYPDVSDVSGYALEALRWACGNGVINGGEIGGKRYLLPGGTATRAQLAEMMARLHMQVTG